MAQPRELNAGVGVTPGIEAMHRVTTVENRLLPERLKGQVFSFIARLEEYNQSLPPEVRRKPEDYAYLRYFFPAFIADRNSRAEEVKSPEYIDVAERARSMLPMTTLAVMCMDGRVKMIHAFGFSADVGSAIRKPGGLLKEFVRGKDGKLKLDRDSTFAKQLGAVMQKGEATAEIYDSHYACAAREKEEKAKGKKPSDKGLFSDVLHKKEMAEATKAYVVENGMDSRNLATIQTTFNPITGYMYMGLETDDAIEFARKESGDGDPVYSKDVLGKLIKEGLIISNGVLIDNPAIRKVFDEHFFQVSWKDDYVNSAKRFWDSIASMRDSVLPIFKRNLVAIYSDLHSDDRVTRRELEERAMLLLSNAFNAYLHNRDHNEAQYLDMSDEDYEKQQHYVYDSHREQGIKVSRGGHPVYNIPMLVIDSEDKESMASDVEFGGGIVRENRDEERITDASGIYTTPDKFASAPVPVVVQEIISDSRITAAEWDALSQIDWTGLENQPWDTWSTTEFTKYVNEKGKLIGPILTALDNLRLNMATLFNRRSQSSAHLLTHIKVALPIICGPDRETYAAVPFVKLGY